MHDLNDDIVTGPELIIDERAKGFLLDVCKWARFLSILGFIGIALMVLFAIIFGSLMGSIGDSFNSDSNYSVVNMSSGLFTVIYLLMAMVYFIPLLYLFRFATNTRSALQSNNQESLNAGFEFLKKHYRFLGYLAVVIIVLYAIGFVLAFFVGSLAMF